MLITFKTKSYANITMFGEVAIHLLKMMEFGEAVPGAIAVNDVPLALTNLKRKLDAIVETTNPDNEEEEVKVSLHTRAMPLLALLQAAADDENSVMWQ